jgi:hypothetical protein
LILALFSIFFLRRNSKRFVGASGKEEEANELMEDVAALLVMIDDVIGDDDRDDDAAAAKGKNEPTSLRENEDASKGEKSRKNSGEGRTCIIQSTTATSS